MYRHDLIIEQMARGKITIRELKERTRLSADTITRVRAGATGVAIGHVVAIGIAVGLPKRALLDDDYRLPDIDNQSEKEATVPT